MKYALRLSDGNPLYLHLVKETLTQTPEYYRRKPTVDKNTSEGIIITRTMVTGTLTFLLTAETVPDLFFLVTGTITEETHIPETRTLFEQTLTTSGEGPDGFILLKEENGKLYEILLTLKEFEITGKRNQPLYLNLNVQSLEGYREIPFEELYAPPEMRFFFLHNEEIQFAGTQLTDITQLKITGTPGEEYETSTEILTGTDNHITPIEGDINLTFRTPREYEPNRKAVFSLNLENSHLITTEVKKQKARYDETAYRFKTFLPWVFVVVVQRE